MYSIAVFLFVCFFCGNIIFVKLNTILHFKFNDT